MATPIHFIDTIWEGIIAETFTLEQVRQRCTALGGMLAQQGWSCLVAYDNRFMSDLFARDLYHVLQSHHIEVKLASLAPPLSAVHNALNQRIADCALVVCAGNKPYWYNGLILLQPDTVAFDLHADPHTPTHYQIPFPEIDESGVRGEPPATITTVDVRTLYLDMLRQYVDVGLIQRATMTIFVDPMHGTTSGYIPTIIGDECQTMAIEINRETDPLFNKVTPLPSANNLNRLRKLVRESDSHLGLAFSADGTALRVVDKNGEHLDHLEIALLLAAYLSQQYRQKGLVIVPRAMADKEITLTGLETWQNTHGIKLELTANPVQRIATLLSEEPESLLVGCTAEGKLIFGHYNHYPDALLAGLFITELIARNGGNLLALLTKLRTHLSE
jgi:phosphomannomutase